MNSNVVWIGVILLIIGVIAQTYIATTTHTGWFGFSSTDTSTPYQKYAFPIMIGGLVLLIVGAFIPKNSSSTG